MISASQFRTGKARAFALAILAAIVVSVFAFDATADAQTAQAQSSAHWQLSNGTGETVADFAADNECLYSVWHWDAEHARWLRWYANIPPELSHVNDLPDSFVLDETRAYWFAFDATCLAGG